MIPVRAVVLNNVLTRRGVQRRSFFFKFLISRISISEITWLRGPRGLTFFQLGDVTSKRLRNMVLEYLCSPVHIYYIYANACYCVLLNYILYIFVFKSRLLISLDVLYSASQFACHWLYTEQHIQANSEAGADEVADELGPTSLGGLARGISSQGWGFNGFAEVHTSRWE